MIRIVRKGKNAIHDYSVWVILSATSAIEITVDKGLKPHQIGAGVNIPATGTMTMVQSEKLQKGVKIAHMLAEGTLSVSESEAYEFKPTYR